ncbi:unnamed protein product [Caenorhabditis bovis]|uniref:Uncharacterized protein n=1 Tax=Caenorhabditis bovis TaxID=2654633 RepID=A0A8S1F122_9PELO|nr:unnamed protein product [Caenorhabditis bovis]
MQIPLRLQLFAIRPQPPNTKVNGRCEKVNKDDLFNEDDRNLYKIVCRRCKSVIFPEDVVMAVENQPHKLRVMSHQGKGETDEETIAWWWYTESDLVFDTVGWQTIEKVKVLMCGDCELGPIGFRSDDNRKYWVAVERVKYDKS